MRTSVLLLTVLLRAATGKAFGAYQRALARRPLLIQVVQTGFLMGLGDCMSQTIVEKRNSSNYLFHRTAQFASIGLFFVGPAITTWYGVLNKYIGSGGPTVAIKKVLCDQLLFAPPLIALLLSLVWALQGKNADAIKGELNRSYWTVLTTNWCVWPAVQLFNFYFMPLQYQVLLNQFVALFWNTYLSWKANSGKKLDTNEKK